MTTERMEAALARIASSANRIEAAAARVGSSQQSGVSNKAGASREKVAAALAQLDALLVDVAQ